MLKQQLRTLFITALLTIICASLPAALAAPGDVDTTFVGFTNDGIVTETVRMDGWNILRGWHGSSVEW